MTRAPDPLAARLRAGAAAPPCVLTLGTLGALGVSTPMIVAQAPPLGVGAATAVGMTVDLPAGELPDGRLSRRG